MQSETINLFYALWNWYANCMIGRPYQTVAITVLILAVLIAYSLKNDSPNQN